tara:strand:+ start:1215 stop:1553 length:339 start_codon:yes stop_codon:yes gene_type:complete
MELLYFILASWGMTQILVYGSIFERQRQWIATKSEWFGTLIHCPMCTGFWVGSFLFGINGLTELFNFEYNVANLLILGSVASATSYALNVIIGDLGIKLVTVNSTLIEKRGD